MVVQKLDIISRQNKVYGKRSLFRIVPIVMVRKKKQQIMRKW